MAIFHNLDPDLLFLIGGYLLYNVVISGVQHQKSVIYMCVCVYIYIASLLSLTPIPPLFLKETVLTFVYFLF